MTGLLSLYGKFSRPGELLLGSCIRNLIGFPTGFEIMKVECHMIRL
jgi:hypothetical protein